MAEYLYRALTFSSPYHLAWFLLSMAVLTACLIASFFGRNWFVYGFLGHAIVVVETVINLTFGEPGPVFSVHCIWFNGFVSLLYWQLIGAWADEDMSDEEK